MPPPDPIVFVVGPGEAGLRLDLACAAHCLGSSRNQIQRINRGGGISVDGRARPDSYTLCEGQRVVVCAAAASSEPASPPVGQAIDVPVVFEDDDVAVVNKPAGLVVHPAHGNPDGTLVNALVGRGMSLAGLGSPDRPGIVHRLDKDTSGLMVVAKNDAAYQALVAAIKHHDMKKEYHAIVHGNLARAETVIDAPIGRHPGQRQKMTVAKSGGKPALTRAFVIDSYSRFAYIRVSTETGRTHQIRVHLSSVSHPLLGDPVYGGRINPGRSRTPRGRATDTKLAKTISRHALHATGLLFPHPRGGAPMFFRSAIAPDMRAALEILYREDRFKEV